MRASPRLFRSLFAFAFVAAGCMTARAATDDEGDRAPSPADMAAMKAVHDFRLTDAFVDNWLSLQTDPSPSGCKLAGAMMNGQAKTLDAKIKLLDTDPDVHKLLAAHHLTARDAMLGWGNLMGAAAVEMQQKMAPGQPVQSIVSDENLKFFRAHEAQMHQRIQAAANADLAANHGKIRCLNALGGH